MFIPKKQAIKRALQQACHCRLNGNMSGHKSAVNTLIAINYAVFAVGIYNNMYVNSFNPTTISYSARQILKITQAAGLQGKFTVNGFHLA